MRQAGKKTITVVTIDSEANRTTVIESVKHTAVSEVGGEPTLLEHLTGESGEDKMKGVVEEHGYTGYSVRQKLSKIIFCTTKIVVYCNKLTNIDGNNFTTININFH